MNNNEILELPQEPGVSSIALMLWAGILYQTLEGIVVAFETDGFNMDLERKILDKAKEVLGFDEP